MAALAIGIPRIAPIRASILRPAMTLAMTASWSRHLPGLESLLELFPPWLLAVPKKKVSHSRKRMRSANKGLKDKQNIHSCKACGRPKLMHNLCHHCFSEIRRAWKGPTEEVQPKERWWNA
ncbi:hypothetical protein M408DRAFT_333132 [Serendipita vermifera MAFF 305830]|uniref:Large ribosomal subunit protein bL32m n=1 Tax=Serendipita vermifera MAFF 305830 TaxID=933852 RepID=A0A0C2W6F6_SERVB|nr:hypothetical protein M408DRAFT_333132 [Serendipita vermifera MAFF 305830]